MWAEVEGAIVLGAGLGRRFGGQPKAFLTLGQRAFAECVIASLSEAGLQRMVAVLPRAAPPATVALPDHVDVVINANPELGPVFSAALGLALLEQQGPVQRALLHPVDHPLVSSDVIRQLLRVARGVPNAVARVVPVYQGRRGHPIVVCAPGLAALRQLGNAEVTTLRDLLASAGTLEEVRTDEPTVLQNLNTPATLDAAQRMILEQDA